MVFTYLFCSLDHRVDEHINTGLCTCMLFTVSSIIVVGVSDCFSLFARARVRVRPRFAHCAFGHALSPRDFFL